MARMIPPSFDHNCSSPGEREIFQRLQEDPKTRDWIVLHSLDIAEHLKQVAGEIDFVVIIPRLGVLCLEVKAHHQIKRMNGVWYFGNKTKGEVRGPFKQAADAMYSLRSKVVKKNSNLSNIVFWSAVIFPYIEFKVPPESSVEWHNWQVIDSLKFRKNSIGHTLEPVLVNARKHLINSQNAPWFNVANFEPSEQQCKTIMEILRPNFEFFENPKQSIARQNVEIRNFTEEQYRALDTMERNKRVVFQGPAGTGKTLLAIESARRSTQRGKRVLLLCYNRMLGDWLTEQTESLSGLTTRTLHQYMIEITDFNSSDEPNFWQEILPQKAVEHFLQTTQSDLLYDEIIIDEAQDLLYEPYLDVIDLSLKGGLSAGVWKMFGDFEKQAIYGRDTHYSLDDFLEARSLNPALYELRINCRNLPRVATFVQLLGGLKPGYSRVLRSDDGAEPLIRYYHSESEQPKVLTDVLDELFNEGYTGKDIVILSPYGKNSCAANVIIQPWRDRLKPAGRVRGGYIEYTTIQSYKGMESPVVIITDINWYSRNSEDTSLFYVGITRALHRLIILVNNSARQNMLNAIINI